MVAALTIAQERHDAPDPRAIAELERIEQALERMHGDTLAPACALNPGTAGLQLAVPWHSRIDVALLRGHAVRVRASWWYEYRDVWLFGGRPYVLYLTPDPCAAAGAG